MCIHQAAFRSIRWILWSLSMHQTILFHHPRSSNLQFFLQQYIQGCVCRSGNIDVLHWNRKWFFFRHVLFDSGFNVITINEFSCDRPEVTFSFLIITAYYAQPRNIPGKNRDCSLAEIGWYSIIAPNRITGPSMGSPNRLSQGVSSRQTRDLECFAKSNNIPQNPPHHSLPRPDCNSTADVPFSLWALLIRQSHLFLICVVFTYNDSRMIPRKTCQIPSNCQY